MNAPRTCSSFTNILSINPATDLQTLLTRVKRLSTTEFRFSSLLIIVPISHGFWARIFRLLDMFNYEYPLYTANSRRELGQTVKLRWNAAMCGTWVLSNKSRLKYGLCVIIIINNNGSVFFFLCCCCCCYCCCWHCSYWVQLVMAVGVVIAFRTQESERENNIRLNWHRYSDVLDTNVFVL